MTTRPTKATPKPKPLASENSTKKAQKRAHLWAPGKSANPKGRVKGTLNKATREVKELCRSLTTGNAAYMKTFKARLQAGKLPPPLEVMAWHYGHGKPKETVELTGRDGAPIFPNMKKLSDDEIRTALAISKKAEGGLT